VTPSTFLTCHRYTWLGAWSGSYYGCKAGFQSVRTWRRKRICCK
jgi:hypothetical protein